MQYRADLAIYIELSGALFQVILGAMQSRCNDTGCFTPRRCYSRVSATERRGGGASMVRSGAVEIRKRGTAAGTGA